MSNNIDSENLKQGNIKERIKYGNTLEKLFKIMRFYDRKNNTSMSNNIYFPFTVNKWFYESNGFKDAPKRCLNQVNSFDISFSMNNIDVVSLFLSIFLVTFYPIVFLVFAIISSLMTFITPSIMLDYIVKYNSFIKEYNNDYNQNIGKMLFDDYKGSLTKEQMNTVIQFILRMYPKCLRYRTTSFYVYWVLIITIISTLFWNNGMIDMMLFYIGIKTASLIKGTLFLRKFIHECNDVVYSLTNYFVENEYDENKTSIIEIDLENNNIKGINVSDLDKKLKS